MSSEGETRDMFTEIKNLKINNLEDDELNENKKKCIVEFTLNKGSYATIAVKAMMV
jgi:tRNA(Glu) U13 pseudouridine synthase TruD